MKPRMLGAVLILIHASLYGQQASKVAPELKTVSGQAAVNVIVQFTRTPTAGQSV
jgi:hypothetical protein